MQFPATLYYPKSLRKVILTNFHPFMHNVEKWPNKLWKLFSVNTARCFKYVWPFFNITHEKVNTFIPSEVIILQFCTTYSQQSKNTMQIWTETENFVIWFWVVFEYCFGRKDWVLGYISPNLRDFSEIS